MKHLPCLKIQSSRGGYFSDLFRWFLKTGSEDVKDVGLAFPRGLERVYVFIEGRLRGGCEWVLGGFGLGLSGPDLMGAGSGRRGRRCPRRAAVSSVVSWFPASETSPFLHTSRAFNWGEFGQRNSIYIHSIWVAMGARGSVIVRRGSSLL